MGRARTQGARGATDGCARLRALRSNARGRFRTRGRYSAVTRGKVAVRDFRRKKTMIVKRGKRYLAKAPVR